MTTLTTEDSPIWCDGGVMEAMRTLHAALGEWERVGAVFGADLDEMAEVERKFGLAMCGLRVALRVFNERQREQS